MDLGLAGKVALVTGAARGMGQATALQLAREGADVVVNDLNNMVLAQDVAAQIRQLGRRSIVIRADIGNQGDVRGMLSSVETEFGQLDILVNNAGIGGDSTLMSATLDEWNEMLRVNLTGPFLCSQAAVPLLRRSRAGRIVSIASEAAYLGETSPQYAASKAGVIALTRAMARELGEYGITVNCLSPGQIPPPGADAAFVERCRLATPLERGGRPEDVKGAVALLASAAGAWITGHNLIVDGGWSVW